MTTKNTSPLERNEQIAFVEWLEVQKNLGNVLRFTSIPNSTYTTSWKQKNENHKMGLRKGLCDMMIILATGNICYCELKRVKGSTTQPEQKEWIHDINLCNNCEARICKGATEAIAFVEEFFPFKK